MTVHSMITGFGKKKWAARWFLTAFLAVLMWCWIGTDAYAKEWYVNEDTGYSVIIEDDADLLTDGEEESLAGLMEGITDYGSVALKTIDDNSRSTESYIRDFYSDLFGREAARYF